MKRLAHALNTKPITVLGIISALHSIIYGLGFFVGRDGFQSTILYKSVTDVIPPEAFGIALLVVGILCAIGFVSKKDRLVRWFSTLQSFVWLFASFIYWTHGYIFLGLGIAFMWVLLSSYMAFAYKNQQYMAEHYLTQQDQL